MHEYRTDNGHTIWLQPVSVLLLSAVEESARQQLIEQGARLDPPTYTVVGVGDAVAEYTHNVDQAKGEDTIAEEPDPDVRQAARAAWDQYQHDLKRLGALRAQMIANLLVADGVVLQGDELERYEAGAWAKRHQSLGVTVPEDEVLRYVHYVMTALVPGGDETTRLLAMLMDLATVGKVDESRVKAAESLFRRGAKRDTAGAAGRTAGAVATQQPV